MGYKEIIFIDRFSLLIGTKQGLIRVNCPFKVKSIAAENNNSGDILIVHEVRECNNQKLVYVIQNQQYNYELFQILFP